MKNLWSVLCLIASNIFCSANAHASQFAILFSFKFIAGANSHYEYLFETKDRDAPEGAPPSQVYQWYLLKSGNLSRLSFVGMPHDNERMLKTKSTIISLDMAMMTLRFDGAPAMAVERCDAADNEMLLKTVQDDEQS